MAPLGMARFAGAEASSHSPHGLFFMAVGAAAAACWLASDLLLRMCASLLPARTWRWLLLCGPDGSISHLDRTAAIRLGVKPDNWCGQALKQVWPALADLIIQERDRLLAGPRDHVVALAQPTQIELATRIRLFHTDCGFGAGILRRRTQRLHDVEPDAPEDTYRLLLEAVARYRAGRRVGDPGGTIGFPRAADCVCQSIATRSNRLRPA